MKSASPLVKNKTTSFNEIGAGRSASVLPQHLPLAIRFITGPDAALPLRGGLFSHALILASLL